MGNALANGNGARTAAEIAAAMLVKLAGLLALWFFFVHGHAPRVDAEATARAFALGSGETAASAHESRAGAQPEAK